MATSFKDLLKAKTAADGPDLSKERETGPGLEPVAGFVISGIDKNAIAIDVKEIEEAKPDEKLVADALAVYDAKRLHSFVKPRGGRVYPINGFFYAVNQEELAMLEDYAKRKHVIKIEAKEEK